MLELYEKVSEKARGSGKEINNRTKCKIYRDLSKQLANNNRIYSAVEVEIKWNSLEKEKKKKTIKNRVEEVEPKR